MCFHTSNTKTAKENEKRFDATFDNPEVYNPYYHLAGYDKRFIYIIKQDEYYDIVPSYWGLMPEYMNISQRNNWRRSTWNARAETIFESNLYGMPIREQRCLILADGFYEPHKVKDKSIPHYIRYKDKGLFAFAGIYTELDDGLYTCSIVTVEANDYFSKIHNVKKQGTYRMPLVLDEKDEVEWINPDLREGDVRELLYSFSSKDFEAYPVSIDVNYGNRDKNRPDIIEPVFYEELNTLF